jgi:outer membrane lipoprotein SlyB
MSESVSRIHPVIATAAGSVIVLCAVGVGVLTGIIPSSFSKSSDNAPVAITAAPQPEAAAPAKAETAAKSEVPAAKPAPTKAASAPAPRRTAETHRAPAPVATTMEPAAPSEPVRVASAEPPVQYTPPPPPAPRVCTECGTVVDVNVIEQKGEGSGVGAVAGAVLGGLLGNQIGQGNGRKLATVAGVAGGVLAGHQAERQIKASKRYDVTVRMEDGTVRHFPYDVAPPVRAGEPVRVVDGNLAPR